MTIRYFPSVDRMSLGFIAPGATALPPFPNNTHDESPTMANTLARTWRPVNVAHSGIPDRVDGQYSDDDGTENEVNYSPPKQKYTPEEELVIMYLYIMLECPWKEGVQLYNHWKAVQSSGSTAAIYKRTEGGLQSAAYRLEDKWCMTKTRNDRDTGKRSRENREIYLARVQQMGREDLVRSLEEMFGTPKDVGVDKYGYRR